YDDKALPAEVKDLTPAAKNDNLHGTDVPAVEDTFEEFENEDGVWFFTAWNADTTAVNGITKDHHFVGTWKLRLNATHEFYSKVADKELPKELSERLPEAFTFLYGEDVKVGDLPEAQRSLVTAEGTWYFVAWDQDMVPAAKQDVVFPGAWEYKAKPVPPVLQKPKRELPKTGTDATSLLTFAGIMGAAGVLALSLKRRKA
ncbi:LPXTG-motif cell wall anchor domain protein, partial [Gleimia coleocanis DSM 15436]